MKSIFLFLFVFIGFAAFTPSSAQDVPPPEDVENEGPPEQRRPNLLAELGLSIEQMQQIRRINQERRPKMMEARRRMGEAMRNLDLAIYAGSVSEAEFDTRLKEFQAAEAALSRLRFESELAVRRVLKPEQLSRFIELRRQFAEKRNQNRQRRMDRRDGIRPSIPEGPFRRRVND